MHDALRRRTGLAGALLAVCLVVPGAADAARAVAGPVELTAQIFLPAGSANGTVAVALPPGFDLVIQTVSFYRSNVAAGSIGQLFVQSTAKSAVGYTSLPEAVADGAAYPTATLSATLYADHGSSVIFNAYRSGSDAAQEGVNIAVNGYYVAVPAK